MSNAYWHIDDSDIPLIEYTNIFLGNLIWMRRGIHNDIATYDLVVREMPDTWSFYVLDGVERALDMLLKYRFDDEAIEVIKSLNLIDSPETEAFYRDFKFSGDIFSMKDGTIFFPGEPIVRVTAPVIQANLITAFLLNAFGYPTRLLTKGVRVGFALGGKKLFLGTDGIVRVPGFEQSIFSLRAAKILGQPIVAPLFFKKFPHYKSEKKLIVANINHAVIKSFPIETDAYEYLFTQLIDKADIFLVMIDTYDHKKGLANFIAELKKHPTIDQRKFMVTIDSGDVLELSLYTRKVLDEQGCQSIKIQAFSNLEEYRIKKLVDAGAPIDFYVAGTEAINITDNPRFEAVYKMAELRKPDGTIEQKAKLTKGKESYPGRKQVFRVFKEGKMVEDIIGLEDETLGEPLLHQFIKEGKLVSTIPNLDETKQHLEQGLASLPDQYKQVYRVESYKVSISQKLRDLLKQVQDKHA